MDMAFILRATFAVPAIEPEWQRSLLARLVPSDRKVSPCECQAIDPDMGQGSREQCYGRQRPLLRLVIPGKPR